MQTSILKQIEKALKGHNKSAMGAAHRFKENRKKALKVRNIFRKGSRYKTPITLETTT